MRKMYFKIENLGPIKSANINLKPLTIFIGENNTGKTYTSYAISGFFDERKPILPIKRKYKKLVSIRESAIKELATRQKLNISVDLFETIEKNHNYFRSMLQSKSFIEAIKKDCKRYSGDFWRFLGGKREGFQNFNISITDLKEDLKNHLRNIHSYQERPINGLITPPIQIKDFIFMAEINKPSGKRLAEITLTLWPKQKKLLPDINQLGLELNKFFTYLFFYTIISFYMPRNVYIFPIHRATLMLDSIRYAINTSSREVIFKDEEAGIRIMDFLEKQLYSKPTINFLRMLDMIEILSKQKELGDFHHAAEKIEKLIMGGKIVIEPGPEEIGSSIKFLIRQKRAINLVVSSSMIQELSSIVLYLKYLAKPGDLLVIDEPEMNLHPKAQMRLLEIITYLVNNGIWVIITTHTPYIVDHLNNLIMAYNLRKKRRKVQCIRKEYQINPDMVFAYEFKKDGKIVSIIEDEGINWESFGKITDEIIETYECLTNIEEKHE